MDSLTLLIADAIRRAREGVEYNIRTGAACPFCGLKAKIRDTKQWLGDWRLRYHECDNAECPLCVIGQSIRSYQINKNGDR